MIAELLQVFSNYPDCFESPERHFWQREKTSQGARSRLLFCIRGRRVPEIATFRGQAESASALARQRDAEVQRFADTEDRILQKVKAELAKVRFPLFFLDHSRA